MKYGPHFLLHPGIIKIEISRYHDALRFDYTGNIRSRHFCGQHLQGKK